MKTSIKPEKIPKTSLFGRSMIQNIFSVDTGDSIQ